jgi:hypothetical protein
MSKVQQEQTKLVGLGRVARSAVSSEMVLPCLDVVLGLTARAVEPLVKLLGAAGFETGDDERLIDPGLREYGFEPLMAWSLNDFLRV